MPEFLSRAAGIVTTATASTSPGLSAWLVPGRSRALPRPRPLTQRPFPVTRGEHDFKFVQLVPLLIGTLAIGDGKQLLHAASRVGGLAGLSSRLVCWLSFVHKLIISLSAGVFPAPSDWLRGREITR